MADDKQFQVPFGIYVGGNRAELGIELGWTDHTVGNDFQTEASTNLCSQTRVKKKSLGINVGFGRQRHRGIHRVKVRL